MNRKNKAMLRYEAIGVDLGSPRVIAKVIAENRRIKSLVLVNNEMKDRDLSNLNLELLVTVLKKIVIKDQMITDAGVREFAEILMNKRDTLTVQEIDISGNTNVTAVGVIALAVFVSKSKHPIAVKVKKQWIKELTRNMSNKGLGPMDISFISPLLKANETLVALNLSGNKMGSNGAIPLSKAIEDNKTLRDLDLHSCGIGKAGWKAIYKSLLKNSTLRVVNLRTNPFRISSKFGNKIKADSLSYWPALSQLELLLDQGSWDQNCFNFLSSNGLNSPTTSPRIRKKLFSDRFKESRSDKMNRMRSPSPTKRLQYKLNEAKSLYIQEASSPTRPATNPLIKNQKQSKSKKTTKQKCAEKSKKKTKLNNQSVILVDTSMLEVQKESNDASTTNETIAVSDGLFSKIAQRVSSSSSKASSLLSESLRSISTNETANKGKEGVQDERQKGDNVQGNEGNTDNSLKLIRTATKVNIALRKMKIRVSKSQEKEQAAIKIQAMTRRHFATTRALMLSNIVAAKKSKEAQAAAQKIQKAIRRRTHDRIALKQASSRVIQKHFRRYFTQKRFITVGQKLALDPITKAGETIKLGIVTVVECSRSFLIGRYEIVGSGPDYATQKYMKEDSQNGQVIIIERKDRAWRIIGMNDITGSGKVYYINNVHGCHLFPPKQGWSLPKEEDEIGIEAEDCTIEEEQHILPKLVHGESGSSLDSLSDKDDDDENLNPVKGQAEFESIRVIDAGSPVVNGLYIASERISNGVKVYEKRNSKSGKTFLLRRVEYLKGKKLWVICTEGKGTRETAEPEKEKVKEKEEEEEETDTKIDVFYVNEEKGDQDEPPDSDESMNWQRGQSGAYPTPMLVWQDAAHRKRQQTMKNLKIERTRKAERVAPVLETLAERSDTEQDAFEKDQAASKIQRCYRAYVLLNLTKSNFSLKQLSRITSIKVAQCGKWEARGTYHCVGTSSASGASTTMSYVLDLPDSGESFLVERINGNAWAIMHVKMDGIPDLMYINREHGYSLYPPKSGWVSSNKIFSPSPKLLWGYDGEDPEEKDNDDDDDDDEDDDDDDDDDDDNTNGQNQLEKQKRREKKKEQKALLAASPSTTYLSKKQMKKANRIQNKYKTAVMVMEAGSLTVHGRYEEYGWSDDIRAYRSNRDPCIHVRRVVNGHAKMWLIARVSPQEEREEKNIIYYYNMEHGSQDLPPTDGWLCYKGLPDTPLVVFQEACQVSKFQSLKM